MGGIEREREREVDLVSRGLLVRAGGDKEGGGAGGGEDDGMRMEAERKTRGGWNSGN